MDVLVLVPELFLVLGQQSEEDVGQQWVLEAGGMLPASRYVAQCDVAYRNLEIRGHFHTLFTLTA